MGSRRRNDVAEPKAPRRGVSLRQATIVTGAFLREFEDPALRSMTGFVQGGVVRLTRRYKPQKGDRRTELVLTFGEPNYHERAVQVRAKRRGEPPVLELRSYKAWKR